MFKLIKILYIIDNVSKNSGVSSVIMNYCSGISKDNFSIDFLLMKKYTNSYEEELIENKSNVFYLSARPNIYTYNKLLKEFKAFLFENRYDIIELHAPTYSFIFMKILKKMNVPIRIIHTHSTVRSSSFFKNILSHVLNFNIKKYANVYFSCSNASGRYWFGNSIENNPNYYTITNGIDIKKFDFDAECRKQLRKKYNLENKIVVGFVGRLSRDKNIKFLADVINGVLQKSSNYIFVIIGSGNEENFLKNKTKNQKKNILFLGHRNDVSSLYNIFDLLVLPSKKEGLPMVAVEAQMMGIFCALSDSITKEVDLGGCSFLPLNKKIWINYILKYTKKQNFAIENNKFDILSNIKQLEMIYTKLINNI